MYRRRRHQSDPGKAKKARHPVNCKPFDKGLKQWTTAGHWAHLDNLSSRHPGRVWMTYHSAHIAPGCGVITPIVIRAVVSLLLHHSSHLIEARCHETPPWAPTEIACVCVQRAFTANPSGSCDASSGSCVRSQINVSSVAFWRRSNPAHTVSYCY